ncbi:MAG: NAD-dependent epimerase/dehydratase family protein, partial [Verrucomicrobia bacterium]|nr:NAD-dependent epimerase/dehydratase family protein [Verrucomicrobiota bacterium]
MKRVLISGGAGLIGSNIVQALCRHGGYQVIVADNLWRGKIEYLEPNGRPLINIEQDFFNLDLTSYRNCLTVTRDVDIVIHLADVVAGIDFVFSNQYFVFQQNIEINTSILKAAIKNNVEKFLYVGTACSYPADKQARITKTPLKEEDAYPANPESGYGWSKLMGEYELGLAADEGLIEASILRLHNVYGPPSEVDPYRSQVIPALCRKAVEFPKSEFLVWGSGRQRRAFVFVSDVVDAILRSLDYGFGK